MRARRFLPATVAVCVLALTVPALAGAPTHPTGQTHGPPAHGTRHGSDGVRGPIAVQLPAALRTVARRTKLASWEVAPGVSFTRWDQEDARGPIRAQLLTIDLDEPGVALDYAAIGAVRDTAPVLEIARDLGAVAAVNGDFFDIGDTGAPLGAGQDRERGLLHARRGGWSSAFYLDAKGRPRIDTLPMRAVITQHPSLKVTNLNSPFVKPGGIGIYTHAWGRTAGYRVTEGQKRNVRMVAIRQGRVKATKRKLSKDEGIGGLLLIGRGRGARDLGRLHKGDRVTVRWRLERAPEVAITGNKFLVEDGLIQVEDDRELHPRTAVGIDHETGDVLLLVVDGRQSFSRGYTMVEMADLMIDLGADEALNLDGGGSSTMVARRPNGTLGVVNSPSDGFQRWVANGLAVSYTPPAP